MVLCYIRLPEWRDSFCLKLGFQSEHYCERFRRGYQQLNLEGEAEVSVKKDALRRFILRQYPKAGDAFIWNVQKVLEGVSYIFDPEAVPPRIRAPPEFQEPLL